MSTKRRLNDWLTSYLAYCENTEPPKSYHTWVGISVIAGALQRKVYTKWGHETIYPNEYIVLIGPSGKCRKGTAMNIGKDLLIEAGIPLASESITREALIRRMKEAVNSFTDATTGTIKFHCSLTAMSDELSVFLGQGDVKFLADLTDWYDSRDNWRYETKGKGTDHIQGVCFNLLGATAPDWLQSILPQEAVGGGFTSRIIFVVEEEKGKIVPMPVMTEEDYKLREDLIHDLQIISNITGEYRYTDNAKSLYSKWYQEQEELARQGRRPIDDPRFSGYCDRRANHIRKLSVIVAASRWNKTVVDEIDFTRAVSLLEAVEKKMPRTFGGLGKSAYSEVVELVFDFILAHKRITRSEMMRRLYRDVDSQGLKMAEEVLEHMKVVKIKRDPIENEVIYEIIEENILL